MKVMFRSSNTDYKLTIEDIKPFIVNAKEKGEHIVCACPLCEYGDKKGHHLYIKRTNDDLILYCQKCNANGGDIIREFRRLGTRHISNEITSSENITVVEDYDHVYKNTDGTVAYYKRRIKYSNGSKTFRFHYTDSNGNDVYKKPNECNVLYNLDLMQIASEQDNIPTLYIVEGEKCADALTDVGLLATTSNTGAKDSIKFTQTDINMLNKFPVKVIIPDNDDKGNEYVKAWSGVSVLELKDIWKNCPQKSDIADYLENGFSLQPIVNFKSYKLTQEEINSMSATEIIDVDFLKAIYKIKEPLARQQILSLVDIRAGELGVKRNFKMCWNVFLKEISSKRNYNGNVQKFAENPPIEKLNCGEWIADMDGIRRFVKTVEEETDVEYASYIPITPSAILKNIENGTEKIKLSFYKDKEWHSINIQRSIIANTNKIIDLADLGVDVNSGTAKLLVKYLADVINLNEAKLLPRLSTVSHLGWVDDKFIPYDENLVTDVGTEYQDTVNAVCESGTLDEWREFVKPLRENIYLRVALATSFSSPLISKVQALPYVLMLWGGSGAGKTVGLQVAASVWGNPAMSKLVKSLNNTINYTMSMLGVLKHLPFFADELQTICEKYGGYDDLLYRVTEGVDRGRMTNSIVQKTNSWQNCMLFTGEEPCTKSMSGGGVKNRVIEVECKDFVVKDGHNVSGFVKKHYGKAGKVFIEALKDYDVLAEYREIYKEIIEATDSTEKQAMAMSLILLGDKISSECIFYDTPLSVNQVASFLKSSNEVDVSNRAYVAICGVVSEHVANFDGSGNVMWGRLSSNNCVYINKSVLERELSNLGFDFNAVKSKWADRGYLIKTKQGRYVGHYSINANLGYYALLNLGYTV